MTSIRNEVTRRRYRPREKCHQHYKHEHKGGGHKQPLAGALRYGFPKPATQQFMVLPDPNALLGAM